MGATVHAAKFPCSCRVRLEVGEKSFRFGEHARPGRCFPRPRGKLFFGNGWALEAVGGGADRCTRGGCAPRDQPHPSELDGCARENVCPDPFGLRKGQPEEAV